MGELLQEIFIDADCAAVPNWVEEMSKPFSDPAIVGVKGTYKTTQKSLIACFVQIEYEEKYERMKKYTYIDFIDTYSLRSFSRPSPLFRLPLNEAKASPLSHPPCFSYAPFVFAPS